MMALFVLLILVGLPVGYAAVGAGVTATIDRWYGCYTCQTHNSDIPPVGVLIALWPLVLVIWLLLRPGQVFYRWLMRPRLPRARVHKAGP